MKIHTVAILGAGAVGAYFIWGLSEKLGENLWVIAEGERKERLEKEGMIINHTYFRPHVRTPKEAKGADLLLVAVKYGSLQSALDDIEKIVDGHTMVLSLLNGVDSEEIIGARIGKEHMIYSMMKIASERTHNRVTFDNSITQGLFIGETEPARENERMLALADLMLGTLLHYNIVKDILQEIWQKYALNISMNQPQAVIGCGIGAFSDSENLAHISKKLREEVVAVAAAKGIDILYPSRLTGNCGASAKNAHYSTLQDLEAKRHTEVEMFAGAMVRMGKELGIPTPYNEMMYHLIKALEEKNDGKFNYTK